MNSEIDLSRLDHRITPRIPPLPSDAADPFGLEAWASYCGVSVHAGLAILASTLAGIAGEACHPCLWGSSRSRPGLNLLCIQGDAFHATTLDSLVGDPWSLQEKIVSRSRSIAPDLLDSVMFEPVISDKNRDILAPLASMDHMQLGRNCADRDYSIRLDRGRVVPEIRYEALVHPQFMLKGSLPPNLRKILVEFHDGFAFSGGCLERLPETPSARHKRVDELITLLDGVTVDPRVGRKRPMLARLRHLRLTGIVNVSRSDLDWIASHGRDLLSRALPLLPSPPDDTKPPCLENVAAFSRRYGEIVLQILDLRRNREPVACWFRSDELADAFQAKQFEYLQELQSLAGSLKIAEAAHLPVMMAWALHTLAWGDDLGDYILDTVFEASRRILNDTVRYLRERDQQELIERRLAIARRVFKRLTENGPCKRRELVRCLDQQSLRFNEPVFRALLGLGIIIESEDRVLNIGLTSLSKLQPIDLLD